jgi:hypothetical protein
MQFSQKVIAVLVGLSVFLLGYLVIIILCNFLIGGVK